MSKKRGASGICFYCGVPVASGSYQKDHFPIPKAAGGTETVIACTPCHDMKDRLTVNDLFNSPLFMEFVAEFQSYGRVTKLFLAKMLRLYYLERQPVAVKRKRTPMKKRK